MKKFLLAFLSFLTVFLICACTISKNTGFIGSEKSDDNSYEIVFDRLNTTLTHNFNMKCGESIFVHTEKEYGDLHLTIQNGQNAPVYDGNCSVAADFSVNISEDGIYTLSLSGKDAKGLVVFSIK